MKKKTESRLGNSRVWMLINKKTTLATTNSGEGSFYRMRAFTPLSFPMQAIYYSLARIALDSSS